MSGGNKRSYLLKQTGSFQVQVYLSMYDLLLPPGIKRLKDVPQSMPLVNPRIYVLVFFG